MQQVLISYLGHHPLGSLKKEWKPLSEHLGKVIQNK